MSRAEVRWLAACGLLLGVGAALVWAGGLIARAIDDATDAAAEIALPDPAAYDAPEWMRLA